VLLPCKGLPKLMIQRDHHSYTSNILEIHEVANETIKYLKVSALLHV